MVKKKKQKALDEDNEEEIEMEDEDLDFDLDKPSTDEDDEEEEIEDSDDEEEEIEDSDDEEEEAKDACASKCSKDSAISTQKLEKFKQKGKKMMKLSMDSLPQEVMKHIAARDHLAKRLRSVIGDFAYDSMDLETLAKYACDTLDLGVSKKDSLAAIHGYLCGKEQMDQKIYSLDSSSEQASVADAQIDAYLKGE